MIEIAHTTRMKVLALALAGGSLSFGGACAIHQPVDPPDAQVVTGPPGSPGPKGDPGAPGPKGDPGVPVALDIFGIAADDPAGLVARAVLPAATFAPGPISGKLISGGLVGGFFPSQPVQGISSLVDAHDGTFLALPDNGYGALENSADFNLRVYRLRPNFKTAHGGAGDIEVAGFIELHDPDHRIKFTIVNHFTTDRVLTGADFDVESLRVAPDGTLWIGDEFGPFLLHFDQAGRLLRAPIPLPDPERPGQEVRSPQNPYLEEATAVRIMNAVTAHARAHGAARTPVFSPWHVHLIDADTHGNRGFNTQRDNLDAPNTPGPVGNTGLRAANDEIVRLDNSPATPEFTSIQAAGYKVVTWTVDDTPRMLELLALGVNGIISDRPDLLYQAIASFDADHNGTPGDLLTPDGLIDADKIDAQAHRGGRDLRPENTIPSYEVGLDNLATTLEMDCGLTSDDVPVMYHDRDFQGTLPGEPKKSRRKLGGPLPLHIRDVTLADIQSATDPILNDGIIRNPATQKNDPALSPASLAYWAARGRTAADIYMMASLDDVFDFVDFYVDYYRSGAGRTDPRAALRWKNAARVRFNIETKVDPREPDVTKTPGEFVTAMATRILANGLEDRADIQSFDFRTLLEVQERYPEIRTVYLFGDFSTCPTGLDGDGRTFCDDSTNFQPIDITRPVTEDLADTNNTPWMAGMYWPYRRTLLDFAVRDARSGGFEGLALSSDGTKLYPLLEKPLDNVGKKLLLSEFDLFTQQYTATTWRYQLETRGISIGEFIQYAPGKGLVIERDGTQGDVTGFKRIFQIAMPEGGGDVVKTQILDLNQIPDPSGISTGTGLPGDVGLGSVFAFPFTTIESVLVLAPNLIAVVNDNNYPFDFGRHVVTRVPADNEFILVKLPAPLP
jgi:glycerophosphoryl diester phosphodiesterase